MGRSAIRAFGAMVSLPCWRRPAYRQRQRRPVLVFPGMEIHQGPHLCTLGYVDPALRVAFTAGHCRGDGPVFDKDNKVIGNWRRSVTTPPTARSSTPTRRSPTTRRSCWRQTSTVNNVLPGGRVLAVGPRAGRHARRADLPFRRGHRARAAEPSKRQQRLVHHGARCGQPARRFRRAGLPPQRPGTARIVGIFNSVWGGFPAAVSWQSTTQQIRQDVGVGGPAI